MTRKLLLAALSLVLAVALMPVTAAAPLNALGGGEPTIENDLVIESFDGTPITATLMLPAGASAASKVPVVMRTHGWGGRREETVTPFLERLLSEGYAVFTWDSRGFGNSGGEANIGSPDFEVKDAQALIDYLATRPEILLDRPGDPRVGWTGGSNAAGVQFNTAAVERRLDAIVPEISWGYLPHDLLPNGVSKQGWVELLYGAGFAGAGPQGMEYDNPAGPQTGNFAQEIHEGHTMLNSTGSIPKNLYDWFEHKSSVIRSGQIKTPTLIIHGMIDTLFPLPDGLKNYANLVAAGTPVKFMTYCSGHTIAGCTYPGGASGYPDGGEDLAPIYQDRIVSWLDRYVKKQRVSTGPRIEWQAQDGYYYSAPSWPLPRSRYVAMPMIETGLLSGPGSTGGDGPADGNPAESSEIGVTAIRSEIVKGAALPIPILGVPKVSIKGTLTGTDGHLYFELIDVAPDGTRTTINDQTTPLALGSGDFEMDLNLNGIAWMLMPDHTLELEVTTGSAQFQQARGGYSVEMTAIARIPMGSPRLALPSLRVNLAD
ncbi:MAG TPA: CocE/NonD family hydrolase [Actinomycetota bacterium]|nr:CocE/NonD family hydrolase [Actinomycetota bacterium]